MIVLQTISQHTKFRNIKKATSHRHKQWPLAQGNKRIMAIVKDKYGNVRTRHLDVPK